MSKQGYNYSYMSSGQLTVLSIRVGKRGSCGPFNSHGSTLMQTRISNCRQYFVGDEILIHSQTSTVASLKFENGWTISFHKLLAMWLFIHAGIKVNHVSKTGPWGVITVEGELNPAFSLLKTCICECRWDQMTPDWKNKLVTLPIYVHFNFNIIRHQY